MRGQLGRPHRPCEPGYQPFQPGFSQRDRLRRSQTRHSTRPRHGGDLLDEPQERPPALARLKFRIAQLVRIVSLDHLVAQGLQILLAEIIQLHPEVENRNRNQMRRIPLTCCGQRCAALLKRGKHSKHLFV
ncbi:MULTISPECIES: hypothetical protein [unclassified Bradyrhizobium]|uniref:hypothetical protein n=1 Tax=unclassified Bradyrhizobium TaxID=2631580 RepID=UPI0029170BC6|nr:MULTISPECIES: hypothetical protein [unclassified Bradyrhizobium]